jgi:hypothetical protein
MSEFSALLECISKGWGSCSSVDITCPDVSSWYKAGTSSGKQKGVLYVAVYTGNLVRKVFTNDTIISFAGTGAGRYSGDSGPATNVTFHYPSRVAVDT